MGDNLLFGYLIVDPLKGTFMACISRMPTF